MRALSLHQPHASAIALSLKLYETRGWKTDYRGPLAIHAAKKVFRERDYPEHYVMELHQRLLYVGCRLDELDHGKLLCVVDLVGCIPTEKIDLRHPWNFWGDFTPGRFAFKLENVRRIWPAIAVTGRQGFFNVEIPEVQ